MRLFLLLGCHQLPAPIPPCQATSESISQQDDALGFSAREVHDAAKSLSWMQNIQWDERFSPPIGANFRPTLEILGLQAETQLVTRDGEGCSDELLARVELNLDLSGSGSLSANAVGWLTGTPDRPELRFAFDARLEAHQLEDVGMQEFVEMRAQAYGPSFELEALPDAGSYFYDHTIIVQGHPDAGQILMAQDDWGNGWNGPRLLLSGTW